MYTRKRRKPKHRGGGKGSIRSRPVTRSQTPSGFRHSSLGYSKRYRKSKVILQKCPSLSMRVLLRKSGVKTRHSRKEMACRITLLERLILEKLDIQNDDDATRKMIDTMVIEILSSNDKLNRFISMNDSTPFVDLKNYNVEKTLTDIFDIKIHGGSMANESSKTITPKRILRPMIFTRDNGSIPHYFILFYEDGEWYIYSSFGSDYVSIGTQKIQVTQEEIEAFMRAMDKDPLFRDDKDKTIVREFMKTYFLANPRQARVRTENSKGNNVVLYYGIWKGVDKETEECIDTHLRVVYVPEIKTLVDELMPHLYQAHKQEFQKAGIRLNTSLAASTNAVSVEPGHRTNI